MVCALMQWQRLSQAHVRSGHVVKGLEEDHSLPQALAVFTEAGCLTGQRCQGLTQRQVHPFDQGCADRMAQGRQAYVVYPRVEETLRYFKEKPKAIVTSKESKFVKPLLVHLGIDEYFDCIIGGDSVRVRKPAADPVLEAIRQLNGTPEKSVMIGDSENDILSGQAAGTITCAVTIGFRTAEQMREYNPDVLIESFDGLISYFN